MHQEGLGLGPLGHDRVASGGKNFFKFQFPHEKTDTEKEMEKMRKNQEVSMGCVKLLGVEVPHPEPEVTASSAEPEVVSSSAEGPMQAHLISGQPWKPGIQGLLSI